MNALSRFIIRLLSPKPGPGQILIYPHLAKDKTGIPHPRKVQVGSASSDTPLTNENEFNKPLPGQLELDAVLKDVQSDTGDVHGKI